MATVEEKNKAIAMRYYKEIMTDANEKVIDELMTQDFEFNIPTHPETYHGPEGFKNLVRMLHGAYPDVSITAVDVIAEGNQIAARWIGKGTHTGSAIMTVLGPISATGKHFEIEGMTWLTFENGKIKSSLANEDSYGIMKQTGVLP